MCGLAGYVGLDPADGLELLRRMVEVQVHRGPDGEGVYTTDRSGLGHCRLAVIDRMGGEQPMRSADGRHALIYNGEVYNYRELRAELSDLGHEFATASDTEVVLAAWRQWGEEAFDRFNGMFALAIADAETGEVVLARDQFGIKPLHLARGDGGCVVFASEIRAILASGLVDRRPDDATIHRYLRFRVHDDGERTFFAGVTRLLPGQLAVVSPEGAVERRTYTRLYDDLRQLAATRQPYDGTARERVAASLRTAIRRRLVSDVPVGTALSGGLDSSTIVTTIDRLLAESDTEAAAVGERQQAFSAVFPGERNDEERYVDAVARGCGGSLGVHKVRPSADAFLADLEDFVRAQEEPVVSPGPYAQYRVMREASRHVTVMVDGQGADEMLAGYLPYHLVHLRQLRRRRRWPSLLTESLRSGEPLSRLARPRLLDRLLHRRPVPVDSLLAVDFLAAHADDRFEVVADDLKARLEDDLFRHSLPALLRYEDRNTMRFSIEGRVPFLDPELLRLLWGLDDAAILHAGRNKRALRDATARLLPPAIVRRRDKIGFTTPDEAWFVRMKNHLYGIFTSESFGSRPYFDQEAVVRAFHAFLRGRASAQTLTFWRLLHVELWLREFIDRDPTAPGPLQWAAVTPALNGQPGNHPPAPPKSDYAPNAGKQLLAANGRWARFPLRVDLVAPGDDVAALAAHRAAEFFAGLDQAPAEAARLAAEASWYLFASEKAVAVAQGRSFFVWEVRPGRWARTLSHFVTRSPYGIGLGHPTTMQLAIDDIGLPRVLMASAAGAVGKALGQRGLFYQVAGARVRAIDGPTQYSVYPSNVSAKLAPAHPARVAREISAAVRAELPPDVVARYGGAVVIDANDLGRNVLGHDTPLSEAELEAAFSDNPLGQGRQQTAFAVVVASGGAA